MVVTPLLRTKLRVPPLRPHLVPRPRLIGRLDASTRAGRKLTLVSAPAGFGKTTLVGEWVQAMGGATPPIAIAWLSLDEGDNDLSRFLARLVAAVPTVARDIGPGVLSLLQSPQTPPIESILTALINEIADFPGAGGIELRPHVLALDDYHVIESRAIDEALTFLLDHPPPNLHLVIAGRADLARLPAGGVSGRTGPAQGHLCDRRPASRGGACG